MKRNLIALALVLFFGDALFTSAQQFPGRQNQSLGRDMVISQYGTLLDIVDTNGQSLPVTVEHDGYIVTYQTRGITKSSSAVGSKNATGLLPGQVERTGNIAIVTVTTADKALEIKSTFRLDPQKNTLSIWRTVKNISGEPLKLLGTRQYVPQELLGVMGPTRRQDLKNLVEQRIRGIQDCGPPAECTEEPKICTTGALCPQLSLRLDDNPDIPDTTVRGGEVPLAECPCECPKQDASASPKSAATAGECSCECHKGTRPANESSVMIQIKVNRPRLK